MPKNSTSWRVHLWVACFAVLLNALAPAISQGLSASRHESVRWEICRSVSRASPDRSAAHFASAAPGRSAPAHSPTGMLAYCAYCLPHAGSQMLPPAWFDSASLIAGHEVRPVLSYHAPRPHLPLAAAPPRGPPAIA